MKKWTYILVFWMVSSFSFSQIVDIESDWIDNGLEHSSVKTFSFENINDLFDSSRVMKWDFFPDIIGSYRKGSFKAQVGAGAMFEVGVLKKLAFQMRYTLGYSNAPNARLTNKSDLQTKAYLMTPFNSNANPNNYIYNDLRFRLTYRPIQQIEVQAGIDQQHFGEGDRSIMMTQQSAPSPFFKLKGNIWRLEYQFLQQLWSEGMFTNNYLPKGAATHYVSYKVNRDIHIGIFESVVYGMKDTLYNRGFSFEYLNPFIFFRPQEYNLGSTDNVVLGMDVSYQFGKNMMYGSFLLDEFLLAEIKARKRWWANKYAAQIGVKSHFNVGSHKFFHRLEATLVRPFTYTQTRPDAVYANEGLAITHPLGASFIELYDEINWKRNKFDITLFLQYYLKGDTDIYYNDKGEIEVENTGGDIYYSYVDRKEEHNYTIGRGITRWRYMAGAHIAYSIMKDKWQVFVEPRFVVDKVEKELRYNSYFSIGIQRKIGANRRNY